MDLWRVFPSLLLLGLHLAAAQVMPPTDVDLHCRNLQNQLVWSYGHAPAGLRFRVDISELLGDHPPVWVDPPSLTADVSFLSDPKNDYILTVTAVMGQNESAPAPNEGLVFSYYQHSLAEKKCPLDLPPVNVSYLADSSVEVAFEHPYLVYKPRMRTSMNPRSRRWSEDELPIFKYTIDVVNQQPHHDECVDEVCQQKFAVTGEAQRICMRITGELEKMSVSGTQEYCAKRMPPANNIGVICGVVIPLALVVIGLILFMVVRKKTNPHTEVPDSLMWHENDRSTGPPQVAPVAPVVHSPTQMPLMMAMEEERDSPPSSKLNTGPALTTTEGDAVDEGEEEEEHDDDEPLPPEQEDGYTHGEELEFPNADSNYESRLPVQARPEPDEQGEGDPGLR